jgi:hypothetical protein
MTQQQRLWLAWAVLGTALVLSITAAFQARAEVCHTKRQISDATLERRPGYRWQWRNVDARPCWYYSNRVLPDEELVWSFTEREFNSDVDRVIQRKFYTPEELADD